MSVRGSEPLPQQQQSHNSPGAARMCSVRLILSQVTAGTISLSSVPGGTFSAFGVPGIYTAGCLVSSWACPPGSPWDRHFPARASQYGTCSLGGVTKNILAISNSITFVFGTSSAVWAPFKHRVSRICAVLSSAKTLEHSFEKIQTPYSHCGPHLKITQAAQMPSQ